MNFLERTAAYIEQHYGDRTGDLYIVLPNRRAGLFLRKHLTASMARTYWAPQIFSIQDFIMMLSGYRLADHLDLTFTLYAVHKRREGSKAQSLNEFIHWGTTLLNDFNDTDLYMADAPGLFSYLTEVRALSRWNPDGRPLTDFEKDYLKFYGALSGYYEQLKSELAQQRKAFPGMAFRSVAENPAAAAAPLNGRKIIFAGLNALTPSEETIVRYFVKELDADVLWDCDEYYLSDRKQEAGRFLRKYLEQWNLKDFKWVADNFLESGRKIHVTGIPGNVSQARYAGGLLKEYLDKDPENISKIAVVLADERMLVPMLNSLPPEISKFNITMGYPLKDTPVFSFTDAVFSLINDAVKFNKVSSACSLCFYAPDVLRLLNHPYIQMLYGGKTHGEIPRSLRVCERLTQNNSVFITAEIIETTFEAVESGAFEPLRSLFTLSHKSAGELLNAVSDVLTRLRDRILADDGDKIELEYIFTFTGILNRMMELLSGSKEMDDIKTIQSFIVQMAGAQTIPFYGEPLEGLQLLGLLETRALGFDTVIMLSANEGILPAAKSINSFIPFDIRIDHGLPVHTEKEAIFAYHFYRLLQHCPDIHFIYNTETDPLGGGEKSRFIEQLLHELPAVNPDTEIIEQILPLPLQKPLSPPVISVQKNGDTLKCLMDKAVTGFAPSTLNAYRSCSLRFYFKEIAGLDEVEDIDETVDSATLGTVIHKVLEDLFRPFAGQAVRAADVKKMTEVFYPMLADGFKVAFSGGDMTAGKNLLILKVAELYVQSFLKAQFHEVSECESKGKELKILELEKRISVVMPVISAGNTVNVLLKGTIDRIDEHVGTLRIIDYKSGKVTNRDLTMESWEMLTDSAKLDKCMQLLMYTWLYSKCNDGLIAQPAIISFRKISSWAMGVTLPDGAVLDSAALAGFEEILQSLLQDILNPELPFVQTEQEENCRYCPYTGICNR